MKLISTSVAVLCLCAMDVTAAAPGPRYWLFFTSRTCPPCVTAKQQLQRDLPKMSLRMADLHAAQRGDTAHVWVVDCAKSPALVLRYDIDVVPMFILVDSNGNVIKCIQGCITAKQIQEGLR